MIPDLKPKASWLWLLLGAVVTLAAFYAVDSCSTRKDMERAIQSERHMERAESLQDQGQLHGERADEAGSKADEIQVDIEASEIRIIGKVRKTRALSDPGDIVARYRALGFKSARLRAVPVDSRRPESIGAARGPRRSREAQRGPEDSAPAEVRRSD